MLDTVNFTVRPITDCHLANLTAWSQSIRVISYDRFCHAMLYVSRMISAAYAVMRCTVYVRLSVTFVHSVETNKRIFTIFLPSDSQTILVFSYQKSCQYSDADTPPNVDVEYAGAVGKNRDLWANIWLHRVLWTVQYTAAMDHGELMTLAGKRRSLLMAGDDDEKYDKKPQHYAEENRAAFNGTQW